MKRVLSLLLVLQLSLLPVSGQSVSGLTSGTRIRVWTKTISKLTGRVEAIDADTLEIQPEGKSAPVSIRRAELTRVEISRGSAGRKSVRESAAWGAGIGGTAGAVSLGIQHEEVSGGSSVGKAAALGAFSGALFGGLIGALTGVLRRGEKWERIQ